MFFKPPVNVIRVSKVQISDPVPGLLLQADDVYALMCIFWNFFQVVSVTMPSFLYEPLANFTSHLKFDRSKEKKLGSFTHLTLFLVTRQGERGSERGVAGKDSHLFMGHGSHALTPCANTCAQPCCPAGNMEAMVHNKLHI